MKKLINGEVVNLTSQEAEERIQEEALAEQEAALSDEKVRRLEAYINEGWVDPYDLIDDILEYGVEAIKQRRDNIKQGD